MSIRFKTSSPFFSSFSMVLGMPVISLPKGRIYRLAFPPSIKKGNWYLGVICKTCKKPIYCLDDPWKGNPAPFSGEGKLSIPCQKCDDDSIYDPIDIGFFQATYSAKSFKDSRPKATGGKRIPLLPKYRKAKVTFGIGALEQRPEAALGIAKCIGYWTYVESANARLLSILMGANTETAVAVYLSFKNTVTKNDAMQAAAELRLSAEDMLLFRALMAYKNSVEKERNALAHGMFGVNNSIKDGVVWAHPTTYTNYQAMVEVHGVTEELSAKLYKSCFVYLVGDLETLALEIEDLEHQIGCFGGYLLSTDETFRATRYHQLCAEPRVAKEIRTILQKDAPARQQ